MPMRFSHLGPIPRRRVACSSLAVSRTYFDQWFYEVRAPPMFGVHPLSAPLQQQGLSLGISPCRGIIQSTRFKVASLSLIEGGNTRLAPSIISATSS